VNNPHRAAAAPPVLLLTRQPDEDLPPDAALDAALARYEVLVLGEAGVEPLASRDLDRVEVLVTGFKREVPRASLPFAEMERLSLVHSVIAGVEDLLGVGLAERRVMLTNSAGCYARPIAEYAFSAAVCLLRGLPELFHAARRAEWLEHGLGRELGTSRLGVVGYGEIGRRVGELARAAGAEVWAITRRPSLHWGDGTAGSGADGGGTSDPTTIDDAAAAGVRVSGLDDLRTMLAWSDIVVVATSLNPTSTGLIGTAEFAAMRPSSYLVNVSRGEVLDEPALVAALSAGAIRGAVLDTTVVEPLPADHPLWRLPNVWITPHIAGGTHEGRARVAELLAANLTSYAEGRFGALRNVVDFATEFGRPAGT
jgi:phosphoglycerate dehydrogenase-like enzyme